MKGTMCHTFRAKKKSKDVNYDIKFSRLGTMPHLTHLCLHAWNKLSSRFVNRFIEPESYYKGLKYLSIRSLPNEWTPLGYNHSIDSQPCPLEELHLHETDIEAEFLAEIIKARPNLKKVSLYKMPKTKHILNALDTCTKLEELTITRAKTQEPTAMLTDTKSLTSLTSLRKLHLGLQISDSTILTIASNCQFLTELFVSSPFMTSTSLYYISHLPLLSKLSTPCMCVVAFL